MFHLILLWFSRALIRNRLWCVGAGELIHLTSFSVSHESRMVSLCRLVTVSRAVRSRGGVRTLDIEIITCYGISWCLIRIQSEEWGEMQWGGAGGALWGLVSWYGCVSVSAQSSWDANNDPKPVTVHKSPSLHSTDNVLVWLWIWRVSHSAQEGGMRMHFSPR